MIERLDYLGYSSHNESYYATPKGIEYLKTFGNPHLVNEYEGVTKAGIKLLHKLQDANYEARQAAIAELKREYDRAHSPVPIDESKPRRKWWEVWK